MQQDFEEVADSVTKSSEDFSDLGYVDVMYEQRQYPMIPQGIYPAICIKAEIKDANPEGQFYKEGDKRIHLTWQIQEPTYKDENGLVRNHRIWSRPLPTSYGGRSHCSKLWSKLTGTNIEDFLTKTQGEISMANGKTRKVTRIRFEHKSFENMVANVVVEHADWKGEIRSNLSNYIVEDEQRGTNFHQLPGMSKMTVPAAIPDIPYMENSKEMFAGQSEVQPSDLSFLSTEQKATAAKARSEGFPI